MKNRYISDFLGIFDATRDSLLVEKHRLEHGMKDGEVAQGSVLDSYILSCNRTAQQVLDRARDVMLVVNEAGLKDDWPGLSYFEKALPAWFVSACLPAGEVPDKDDPERRFPIDSWLHWAQPSERMWLWLNAEVLDSDRLLLDIDRIGDPGMDGLPFGMWWLFKAAGAREITEIEDPDQMVQMVQD
jgi:hypothetical protein